MIDLFQFVDYRNYLRAVFQDRKSKGKYSYAQFAEELGFQERSFVQHLLACKRELSESSLDRVLTALALSAKEQSYFRLLHQFSTSKDAQNKQQTWQIIRQQAKEIRNEVPTACQRLDLMDQWYAFAIKELLCAGVVEDIEIRKALSKSVSLETIRQTIAELIRLEFVAQSPDGKFRDLEPEISAPTQEEYASVIHNFQAQMQQMAVEALSFALAENREYQSLSLSLSEDGFFKVRQALRQCRDQIIEIYGSDTPSKKGVFHVNLTLFPMALLPKESDQ